MNDLIFLFDTQGECLTKMSNVTERIEKVTITKQIFFDTVQSENHSTSTII